MAFDPNLAITPLAAVLPIVVGAVTKSTASSALKGWTLAALSALTGLLAELAASGVENYDWEAGFSNFLLVMISAFTAYKSGLVKGVSKAVADKTHGKGIGSSAPTEEVAEEPAAVPAEEPKSVKVVPTTEDDPEACTDPSCVPDEELVLYTEEGETTP